MAPPPPPPPMPPLFLIFVVSCIIATPSLARLYDPRRLSTTAEDMDGGGGYTHAGEVVAEELFSPGVVRSSPARPMPSYNQNAAPVPLPEFPTLGPPVVWSFPAAPLPAIDPPPPQDIPVLPGTNKKHHAPRRPCHGHHYKAPPPSGPVVATEPAVSPGSLEAPENAPEPTAGGPSPPS